MQGRVRMTRGGSEGTGRQVEGRVETRGEQAARSRIGQGRKQTKAADTH